MADLIAPFIIGMVGSLHCLGMCGPLIMAYSVHIRAVDSVRISGVKKLWAQGISHHLAFHAGRILTYGMLGALGAVLAQVGSFNQIIGNLRGGFTLGAGIAMFFLGLVLLKAIPVPSFALPSFGPDSIWARIFFPFFRSKGLASKFALGMGTGFLPCMLSWAMILKASTSANLLTGFLTTVSFGLGTLPALFFTGLSASLLSLKIRLLGERIAAAAVIVMGLILIFKGTKYFA